MAATRNNSEIGLTDTDWKKLHDASQILDDDTTEMAKTYLNGIAWEKALTTFQCAYAKELDAQGELDYELVQERLDCTKNALDWHLNEECECSNIDVDADDASPQFYDEVAEMLGEDFPSL